MNSRAVVDMMCVNRGLEADDVRGDRRFPELVRARVDIAKMLRQDGYSYPEIGRALGNRHHTTIMYLLGEIERPRKRTTAPGVRA